MRRPRRSRRPPEAAPLRLADGLHLYEAVGPDARNLVVRRHLAGLLGCSEEAVAIVRDARGKPRLRAPTDRLSFSLSRRGRLLLIATAWGRPVGADLELIEAADDAQGIARNLFAPGEAAWLESLDHAARRHGFVRLWTAKEAVLKARGIGIVDGLAEPDLTACLVQGAPLAPASATVAAGGEAYRVAWFAASTVEGEVCAARAEALLTAAPDCFDLGAEG